MLKRIRVVNSVYFHILNGMNVNDFSAFGGVSAAAAAAKEATSDKDKKGVKREYLKIFETLPPQLHNAYGEAKFMKLSDATVPWRCI